jgi:hypothetical protein
MKIGAAVLLAAFIVAAALIGSRFLPLYEIHTATDGEGNPMLWRINRITGYIEICPALNIIKAKKREGNPFNSVDPNYHPACE